MKQMAIRLWQRMGYLSACKHCLPQSSNIQTAFDNIAEVQSGEKTCIQWGVA
jgi:hypothetical protein